MAQQTETDRPRSGGVATTSPNAQEEHGREARRDEHAERPAPSLTDRDIPEQPALAPGIELAGPMEDTALEQPPWLVLRNGAYVRLSELLYRILEQVDGRRPVADIAAAVADRTGRPVSERNVRQLLAERLLPLGLVRTADGAVVDAGDGDDSRSPLQISARTTEVPGHILQPVARAFGILFTPPLLVGVLALGLTALGWLFMVHGLGPGFHGAVYQPWLILVLLPLIVASAAFHELGHAAALAYGGGRVRGMGAGLYTAYPVFFTDVTDNYRLNRWARVRTDLGGFHFNLVFALAIVAVYLVTGHEFLLLAVLAIAVSVVHQAIPIVRLDGYWALADTTGIPDPLAYMGRFLKSIVPLPAWRDERPPAMKRWAKVLFLVWMAVTIPLLVVLGVYMLASAPRVLGTAVDSLFRQVSAVAAALAAGDAVGVLAGVTGIAVLAVTTLAFGVFLLRTLRGMLGRLWRWAGDDSRRRAAAAGGTLTVAGFLAFLWAPPLPITGNRAGPFHDFSPIAEGESLTLPAVVSAAAQRMAPPPAPPPQPAGGTSPELAPEATEAPVDLPNGDAPAPVDPGDVDVPDVEEEVPDVEEEVPEVPEVPDVEEEVPEVPDEPVATPELPLDAPDLP